MNHYYAQWDREELDCCGDLEDKLEAILEGEFYDDEEVEKVESDECPRCSNGCNYCLMLSY